MNRFLLAIPLALTITGCATVPPATTTPEGAEAFMGICMDTLPSFNTAVDKAKSMGIDNYGHVGGDEDYLVGINSDGSVAMYLRQYSATSEWCRVSTPLDTKWSYGPIFYKTVMKDLDLKNIDYEVSYRGNNDNKRISKLTAYYGDYEMYITHVSRGGEMYTIVRNDI
ncbi:hypothetical protein AB4259_19815 [Vibrio amylolyticus]|uniref:hypothetical protein n=1 Tax=Vibrio amylolyticus TaxID=2847292 RepID=UPI00354AF03A